MLEVKHGSSMTSTVHGLSISLGESREFSETRWTLDLFWSHGGDVQSAQLPTSDATPQVAARTIL
jgi:hypothetical protein